MHYQQFRMAARVAGVLGLLAGAALAAPGFQTQTVYLSGTGVEDAVPWKFRVSEGMRANQPGTIPVPGCWELHGYGAYSYGHDKVQPNEVGYYEREFAAPAEWRGQRVFLVFDGVMTDAEVKVNGQVAGPVHQGAYYRFKHEITALLKWGAPNTLEVVVHKESANASVNRAERRGDYWNYSGIFRPVSLQVVPPQFVERMAIHAQADGAFTMQVFSEGKAEAVRAEILTLQDQPVGEAFQAVLVSGGPTVLQTRVKQPQTWTAETPNLYKVRVSLLAGGQIVHQREQRFGFRTMEVRAGDGLYVNGSKVRLKGTCRHSFHPDSGRALSRAISRADIELMQAMNMNAVRMSHYPPDEHFLDLCDELGMYVLDELAGWQKCYDADIGARLLEEMVTRDVNHPAILFWDNGNEGGWNTALDTLFAKYDPQQRHVLHPWALFGDVDTKHYAVYSAVVSALNSNHIYMPTEFVHGLYDGGQGAGLEDYWNLMLAKPNSAGGFTWALVDEAVKRTDQNGRLDANGNLAPDGIVGPHREKEGSFYTIQELWSPVRVLLKELPANFDGAVPVHNTYAFTDLSACRFSWALVRFPAPDAAPGHQVIAQGNAPSPAVPPDGKGAVKLPLPADWRQADALRFTATNPNGRELWTWTWPIIKASSVCQRIVPPAAGKAAGQLRGENIVVQAGDAEFQFSAKDGLLQKVLRGGNAFSLSNGPVLVAENQPEGTKKSGGDKKKDAAKNPNPAPAPVLDASTPRTVTHHADGGEYVIRADYDGPTKFIEWRVRGNGWLQLRYAYALQGEFDCFGVSFDYPESQVKAVKWLGQGPYRVWKNRLAGTTLDVHRKNYNDTLAGQTWEYPEFKGYHAGLRWAVLETGEGPLTVVANQEDLFLRLFTPQTPIEPKSARMIFPAGNLSFLHAIAPIGNKFHKASDTGPMGMKNQASGTYQGEVFLKFGP
ncbi:MAG: glycoside hydrolase family 2 TIM barrel-domain containing protein [Verrucomicrobiota bacterium]